MTTSETPPSSAKSAAILAGAMQEFLQHGYEGSSMDRVAAQAGVAKATVYAHFRDKEALFTALIHTLAAQKLAQLLANPPFEVGTLPTRSQLQQAFSAIIVGIAEDDQFLGFIRLVVGESGRFPHLAEVFIRQMDIPLMTTLEGYLAPLGLPDASATARIISGTILATVLTQHVLHGGALLPLTNARLTKAMADAVLAQSKVA